MDEKKRNLTLILLFTGFLTAMLAGLIFLPKKDFSENEKRYLTQFPPVTAESILSGEWGDSLETYLADRLPMRDFFVGLNAYYDRALGLQATKEIRTAKGRLIEAPVTADSTVISRNMGIINQFADTIGRQTAFTLVPSCGWALGQDAYPDEIIIRQATDAAGKAIVPVDLTEVFQGKPELYYKTDHHWNSLGAYHAYCRLMDAFGREAKLEDTFRKEVFPGCFLGSTYSRSALWLTEPEDLELWHGSDGITAENREDAALHNGVFYTQRLNEADKYTVFLNGNHSVVTLRNPAQDGKILVIRDSYSNCLGCFLAESYGEVILVDLRYFKSPVSALIDESIDDILICYSVGNFMTDTNLILLR